MKKWWMPLVVLGLVGSLLLSLTPTHANPNDLRSLNSTVAKSDLWYNPPGIPTQGCAIDSQPNLAIRFTRGTLTLRRFRQPLQSVRWSADTPAWLQNYRPPEEVALAHPTNFGERFQRDITGASAARRPVIVLHETVMPGWQTVKFFQTPHDDGSGQASYHALIKQNGTIFYMVPPDKRAFGAGNSTFYGPNGEETTRTTSNFPSSVNNFAYHVSLETPSDGAHNGNSHSGYSDAQYASLAWLVAKTGVSEDRITTHQSVDRSGSRKDPRSFERAKFSQLLNYIPKTKEITIGCWRY
jgi:hypothetical protein